MKKPIYYLGVSLLFIAFLSCKNEVPVNQTMSPALWEEDINHYIKTLEKKHINLYHSRSKAETYKSISVLKSKLSELSDDAIFVELMKITRSFNDSHTGTFTANDFYKSYPFGFFVFEEDEIRVLKTTDTQKEILGAKLLSIDGKPINEIYSEIKKVAQNVNNDYSEKERVARYIKYGKLLYTLKITKKADEAQFTFLLNDQTEKTVTLKTISNNEYSNSLTAKITFKSPFQYNDAVLKVPGLWFQADKDKTVGYINFSSYPSRLTMKRFSIALVRELIKHNTQNIIIDLRDNGGGNSFIGHILAKILTITDHLDFLNGVYVLTGRYTYSAGMSNTADFQELLHAKLVGEPTGSNPNDYQDTESFLLPHSKTYVMYSKRIFRYQHTKDSTLLGQGILPDVHIKPQWDDYKEGIDAPLQWILEAVKNKQ